MNGTTRTFILICYCYFFGCSPSQAKARSHAAFSVLVHEMTVNATRQQNALDKIALSEDEAVKYLPLYFDDKRKVATANIRFLNTHPNAMEKYFSSYGTTAGEVLIRYCCFRTEKCIPTVDPGELEEIRRKFSKQGKPDVGS